MRVHVSLQVGLKCSYSRFCLNSLRHEDCSKPEANNVLTRPMSWQQCVCSTASNALEKLYAMPSDGISLAVQEIKPLSCPCGIEYHLLAQRGNGEIFTIPSDRIFSYGNALHPFGPFLRAYALTHSRHCTRPPDLAHLPTLFGPLLPPSQRTWLSLTRRGTMRLMEFYKLVRYKLCSMQIIYTEFNW